jgi:putative hemolysin
MSDDELRELVDAHDGLGDEEREIVGDVLHAADRTLAEVMRHRADMVAIRGDLTLDEARKWAREQPYSRYPVLHSGVDEITTFVHVRDLAWAPEGTDLASIERPLAGLPATARILPTLTLMRREGDHIALVVDEYGGVDGIVTLEDIVEELIGEVYDEYDDDAHDDHNAAGSAQLVPGSLTIEEFADRTGFVVDDGPFETIAGYVIDRLGRMPLDGDTVETADARLTVRGVERRRIVQIEVERLATSPS